LRCAEDAEAFERYDSAYFHAVEAYHIHPDRKKLQGYLVDLRTRSLMLHFNPQSVLDSLAEDEKKYPFFAESDLVHFTRFFAYAEMARAKFAADENQQAERYLQQMHDLEKIRPVSKREEAIGWAYSAAVSSYVRQVKYDKARYYLKKGLELAPFNEKMNSTKRLFKKELGVE
jgi:tetratricopeptide (TPR) repeat protein